jgi:hypothetical protein
LYLFIEQNKLSYEKINEYLKDPISFIPHFTNSQERETLDLLLKYNINFSLTNNELILIGKVSTDVIKFFVNNYPLNIINKENFIHQLLLMNEIIFLQGPEHKHNQKRTKDADERQTKLLQLFNLL